VKSAVSADAAAAFEARSTWWSALAVNVLVLAAGCDRLVSEEGVGRGEMILRAVSIAYGLAICGALLATRKRPSLRFALFAWTGAIVPYLFMLPVLGRRWVAMHLPWEPMFRQTLAMLLLGAYAPARVVFGVLPIVLVFVECIFEYWLLGVRNDPYLRFGSPARVAFYAAFAIVLAYRRSRALQHERALVERDQEALALERLARVAVAVHDVSNSALQTLVASVAILERDAEQAPRLAPGIGRAVGKLQSVNAAFDHYQRQVDWRPGDESFDAAAVLASAGAVTQREEPEQK
jgi:hypothetical protein